MHHDSRFAHKVEQALRPRASREPPTEENDRQGEQHVVDLALEPRLELVEEVFAKYDEDQLGEPAQRVLQQRVQLCVGGGVASLR